MVRKGRFLLLLLALMLQTTHLSGRAFADNPSYIHAVEAFEAAENSREEDNHKEAATYYEEALRQAQWSLEMGTLTKQERSEVHNIIDRSRTLQYRSLEESEYMKRDNIYNEYLEKGHKYSEEGVSYSNAGKYKLSRESIRKAILYYKKARRSAQSKDQREKAQIYIDRADKFMKNASSTIDTES
jgi:tetratricopeptide (TPR) repeat protein